MVLTIIREPSPHAKEKGLRKGQRHQVIDSGMGENRAFPGQWFYTVQPPIGKSHYAFYEEEINITDEKF